MPIQGSSKLARIELSSGLFHGQRENRQPPLTCRGRGREMDNAKAPTLCGHEACNCANAEKVSPYLVAQAERAVVEAAMEYERVRIHTQDAREWNAVKLMLREACAALDRARKGGE